MPMFKALARGYLETAGPFLTKGERALIALAVGDVQKATARVRVDVRRGAAGDASRCRRDLALHGRESAVLPVEG